MRKVSEHQEIKVRRVFSLYLTHSHILYYPSCKMWLLSLIFSFNVFSFFVWFLDEWETVWKDIKLFFGESWREIILVDVCTRLWIKCSLGVYSKIWIYRRICWKTWRWVSYAISPRGLSHTLTGSMLMLSQSELFICSLTSSACCGAAPFGIKSIESMNA